MNKLPVGIAGQYSVAFLNPGSLIFVITIITLLPLYPLLDVVFQATESEIQSVCAHVNDTAQKIHQFPYMMQQHLTAIEQSILDNLRKAMVGLVIVLEAVILWFVDVYKSTYRCLLAFAVNTVLAVFTSIAAPLQEATTAILKGVNNAAGTIGSLFNHPDTSVVPVTLSNWTQSMQDTQAKVNQWTNGTDQLHQWLSQPFDSLKQQINNTSFTIQNTASPPLSPVQTYCDTGAIIEDLQDVQTKAKYILNVAIGILIGAILLSILVRLLYIRYCYRYLQRLRYKVIDCLAPQGHPEAKPMSDNHIPHLLTQNAILARFGDACKNPILASVFYGKTDHVVHPPSPWHHWLLFVFQNPILPYCLCVALVGLVTTYSLLAVIKSPSSMFPSTLQQLDTKATDWFQMTVQNTTQQIQQNVDAQFQTTNQWIAASETLINDQLFDTIREFAKPMNATLDSMIHHLSDLITTTVGGTIMETPAKGVLDCLILNKLDSLQQGVEWLVRSGGVHLPRIQNIVVPLAITPEISLAPSKTILRAIEGHLRSQIYFYWFLFSLWAICAMIGLVYVIITNPHQKSTSYFKRFIR